MIGRTPPSAVAVRRAPISQNAQHQGRADSGFATCRFSGATLSLGAQGQIVLTVDSSSNGFVISTPGYDVFNRYAGSVLMLCDAATTPGTSTSRYVAVAASVATGGAAAEAVTNAAALAGKLLQVCQCSYPSANGSQEQNTAADSTTLRLDFDTAGNATSNAISMTYTPPSSATCWPTAAAWAV